MNSRLPTTYLQTPVCWHVLNVLKCFEETDEDLTVGREGMLHISAAVSLVDQPRSREPPRVFAECFLVRFERFDDALERLFLLLLQ